MPAERENILKLFHSDVRKILGKNLKKVILYGSYARGDYNDYSDMDVMILTSLNGEEIEKAENNIFNLCFDFLMDYGVDIRAIVKNEDHFKYWLGALPFYDNVQREGIVLNG